MKKNYIVPEVSVSGRFLEDGLLEVSGRSADMGYEENTDIGWTY